MIQRTQRHLAAFIMQETKAATSRRLKGEIDTVLESAQGIRFSQFNSQELANFAEVRLKQFLNLDMRMLARALVLNSLMNFEKIDIKEAFATPEKYFRSLNLLESPDKLGRAKSISHADYLASLLSYLQVVRQAMNDT